MKRGTNYNHRMAVAQAAGLDDLLSAVAHRRAECAAGRHDVTEVPRGWNVFAPYGRRREPGERYCVRCSETLPADLGGVA